MTLNEAVKVEENEKIHTDVESTGDPAARRSEHRIETLGKALVVIGIGLIALNMFGMLPPFSSAPTRWVLAAFGVAGTAQMVHAIWRLRRMRGRG